MPMLEVCCSRRGLIRGTLATAAVAGLSWPATAAEAAGRTLSTVSFVSRPDLKPPRVRITHQQAVPVSPRYFLVSAEGPVGGHGPLIVDRNGDTVWFSPVPHGEAINLDAQTYQGEPVLTWWSPSRPSPDPSFGVGLGYIANRQYKVIAKVAAGNGLSTDFHELNLTSRGTALITARRSRRVNLSKVGGPAKGYAWSGVAQEIDVATGKVVSEWDSLDHVEVTETLHRLAGGQTANYPFDYFHINSIGVAHDGDLLISARNTCAVYKVDRASGAVRWRLGGKKSSFAMGPGATFWWQHDAREVTPDVLSIFDDASEPCKEPQSRGILLDLDTAKMRATLSRAYTSSARPRAANQGSMQVLDDGRVLVGWGSEPAFTEFAADGTEILNAEFPRGDYSYRAFAADWAGSPDDRPAAVARRSRSGGAVVYMSWNGATDLASWTVYAGPRATELTSAVTQPRTSFETAIFVPHDGPYFVAAALDADGHVLGRSATVRC
jgi:hypothetical protein